MMEDMMSKLNVERCDSCGKFVPIGQLLVDRENEGLSVCSTCDNLAAYSELQTENSLLRARLDEAATGINELRAIMGPGGNYAFARRDGERFGMYDQILIGDVLEKLEKSAAWLDAQGQEGE
jgi:hypothetical protein